MEGIIELAIAVGRLENRISELEKKLAERPAPPIVVDPPADDKMTPDKLLQQGIDSIMGYQWPPARGGDES